MESLPDKIHERVLKLGKSDTFVKEKDDWNRRKSNEDTVTLGAEDIFIYPPEYLEALADWKKKKKAHDRERLTIEGRRDAIIVKITIGSDKTLEKLVNQADQLIDLDLDQTQLLLTDGGSQKQLE